MTPYEIRNLKEVEDSAVAYGLSPHLETRFARDALGGESVGVSYQRLGAGVRVPFGHRHAEQEEIYVVVGGAGRLKLDDEVVDVRQWDAVRIAPETMRCLEAGPDGLEVLLFGAGAARDGEIVQGWWADEG